MSNNSYKIYNLKKEYVGTVFAVSIGEAKNKAVAQKIIPGRKQITKVLCIPYEDPYEQSFEDIFGSTKSGYL